jgi:hypothetical protein
MKLPEYITAAEVKRVCKNLGIRDWSKLKKPKVMLKEAKIILKEINPKDLKIDIEQFRIGLEVELEHGTVFKNFNVTNNHPILTGKIVLAHFMESLDYYKRLEVAELEGDMLKAIHKKNLKKITSLYKRIAEAKIKLSKSEVSEL